MTIINFGHKLKEAARAALGALTEYHLPFVLDFDKSISDQMLVAFNSHVKPLIDDIEEEKKLHIMLPGSSVAASFLLTAITTYLGYAPKVILFKQEDGEWVPAETADLQLFKNQVRNDRDGNAIKL